MTRLSFSTNGGIPVSHRLLFVGFGQKPQFRFSSTNTSNYPARDIAPSWNYCRHLLQFVHPFSHHFPIINGPFTTCYQSPFSSRMLPSKSGLILIIPLISTLRFSYQPSHTYIRDKLFKLFLSATFGLLIAELTLLPMLSFSIWLADNILFILLDHSFYSHCSPQTLFKMVSLTAIASSNNRQPIHSQAIGIT